MAFEVTWMVGYCWCLFLKYPSNIHSLLLRSKSICTFYNILHEFRTHTDHPVCLKGCVPREASYIAVVAPVQTIDSDYENKYIAHALSSMGIFQSALSFLYSDNSLHPAAKGVKNTVTFCKVRLDARTGSRYFYFRFRRYIFDGSCNKFIPGSCDVTQNTTICQWLDTSYLHQGLSCREAAKRLGIVGPNELNLREPSVLSCIATEFSKPFYLYQTFMVWTWGTFIDFYILTGILRIMVLLTKTRSTSAPFWYYYMAIVNTVIRISGGLVVAVFQYMSDKVLYQLMVMHGTVEVFRGGEVMEMDQSDIVPGDIIRLMVGL
jgi:hypothetical protein